jgi:hypothetical protein
MLARIKWALTMVVACVVAAAVTAAVLFVAYEWNMAGYDTYRHCRPGAG